MPATFVDNAQPIYADETGLGISGWTCSSCDSVFTDRASARACCFPWQCERCEETWQTEYAAEQCCPDHVCVHCGERWASEDSAIECCREDDDDEGDRARVGSERIRELADRAQSTVQNPIYLPDTPDRPARLVSCEQEISSGGSNAMRILYMGGFVRGDSAESYRHSHPESDRHDRTLAYAVEDSSLESGGVEIVWDRLQLWDEDVAASYAVGLQSLYLAHRDDAIDLGYDAGHHIHVSARDRHGRMYRPCDIANLYAIFCHCEDLLYRLAATGWGKHRSDDNGYSRQLEKLDKSQRTIARCGGALTEHDRFQGLNIHPTINSMRECSCGAFLFGDWQNCRCAARDKATIEWRLFNGATRPETIHAWIALAHSLTELATRETVKLGDLENNTYGSDYNPSPLVEQLDYVMTNAPLTENERHLVLSIAKRSPGLQGVAEEWSGGEVADWGMRPELITA